MKPRDGFVTNIHVNYELFLSLLTEIIYLHSNNS